MIGTYQGGYKPVILLENIAEMAHKEEALYIFIIINNTQYKVVTPFLVVNDYAIYQFF